MHDKIIEALETVIWYNGYYGIIQDWIDKGDAAVKSGNYPQILDKNEQLEVIWMICVSMFGDYGTSPRSGWITDWKSCREFLVKISGNCKEESE